MDQESDSGSSTNAKSDTVNILYQIANFSLAVSIFISIFCVLVTCYMLRVMGNFRNATEFRRRLTAPLATIYARNLRSKLSILGIIEYIAFARWRRSESEDPVDHGKLQSKLREAIYRLQYDDWFNNPDTLSESLDQVLNKVRTGFVWEGSREKPGLSPQVEYLVSLPLITLNYSLLSFNVAFSTFIFARTFESVFDDNSALMISSSILLIVYLFIQDWLANEMFGEPVKKLSLSTSHLYHEQELLSLLAKKLNYYKTNGRLKNIPGVPITTTSSGNTSPTHHISIPIGIVVSSSGSSQSQAPEAQSTAEDYDKQMRKVLEVLEELGGVRPDFDADSVPEVSNPDAINSGTTTGKKLTTPLYKLIINTGKVEKIMY